MKKYKLLLVEDDESFGYILTEYLGLHQFEVTWIKNGTQAIQLLRTNDYDICILDIMLPGTDGFSIALSLKESAIATPFLFLTARSLKIDKLKGFSLGCDDYEIKPIDEELLLAKLHAILKRTGKEAGGELLPPILKIGNFLYDVKKQTLSLNDNDKILTDTEASLIKLLFAHKNELVQRKKILIDVWGVADIFSRKSMDVFISRLRKYFAPDPQVEIVNIHNKGFILKVPDTD